MNVVDPSGWTFIITDEERERVHHAYLAFRMDHAVVPDVESLIISITMTFEGDLREVGRFFGETLVADMPAFELYAQGAVREQLQVLWRNRKIESIVRDLGFDPLIAWDAASISACLKAPEQVLTAGQELVRLEREGYALLSTDLDEGLCVFSWRLRRRKEASEP